MAFGKPEARRTRLAAERAAFSDTVRAQSAEVRPTAESLKVSSLFETRAATARVAAHDAGARVEAAPQERKQFFWREKGPYPTQMDIVIPLYLVSTVAAFVGGPLALVNPIVLGAASERLGNSFRNTMMTSGIFVGGIVLGVAIFAQSFLAVAFAVSPIFLGLIALGWGVSRLLRKKKN